MRVVDGKRLVGPFEPTKSAALESWKIKQKKRLAEKARPEEQETSLGTEYYWCLFGVRSSDKVPTTRGIWADELAITTYQLYKDAFRARISKDPIADMDPSEITVHDLEAFRTRMLRTRTTYTRNVQKEVMENGRRVVKITKETIQRPPPNPRTVMRYLDPVIKVLHRFGNKCADDLGSLKLPPPAKGWLPRKDRDAFLKQMPSDELRLAALMMLNGMCIGEVCQAKAEWFDGETLRIEEQLSHVGGKGVERFELKRTRRYRNIPVSDDLRAFLEGKEGRLVSLLPNNLRRSLRQALEGTRWQSLTPHDLRRSGGKWMLDKGAKLSDVAAILGNDPKTLLVWYDMADQEGMAKAVRAV